MMIYPQFHVHREGFGDNLTLTVLTTNIRKKFRGVWYLITVRSEGVHNTHGSDEIYRQFMRDVYAVMLLAKKHDCISFNGVPMVVRDECQLDEVERLIQLL